MSDGIEFDEDVVSALERIYQTASMTGRRRRILEALALDRGERVLSVGCGPGFESQGLAGEVGESGRVHGIDASGTMLTVARDRCADLPQATFGRGSAAALPLADRTVDAATAVQVYEYVVDLETAFAELYRVLTPGGRAVVFDTDWSTLTYHATDHARSERITGAYDAHCPHPRLARTLKPRLERAGFEVTDQDAYVHFETEFGENTLGQAFIAPLKGVVTGAGGIDETEFEAWVKDIRERGEAGEFFFNLNQYLFLAKKPEGEG